MCGLTLMSSSADAQFSVNCLMGSLGLGEPYTFLAA